MDLVKLENKIELTGKKDYINLYRLSEPKQGVLFSHFVIALASKRAKRFSPNYVDAYKTLVYHINRFSDIYGVNIYTNSVNEEFLSDFILYLQGDNLKQGYIKYLLSLCKAMIRKASSYGFAVDPTFDDIDIDNEQSFSIYLSMNDIVRIYYFKGLTRKQERIRDLFIVGCLTGLRYSDYSNLDINDIQGDKIIKVTKKTNKKVYIPIHDYVREIFIKYDYDLKFGICNQHFNRYLKRICKLIGFDEDITYSYHRGNKLVTETRKKWELISSHTARRSAVTNMLQTGRIKPFEIMPITGHTTEKSLFGYNRISGEEISNQISGDTYFRK